MSDEDQANLSMREQAINNRNRLSRAGIKSPDYKRFFGVRINRYTTYYYSSRERMLQHIPQLQGSDLFDPDSFKLIDPLDGSCD